MSKKSHTIGNSESGVRPILGLALLAAMIYAAIKVIVGGL